MSNALNCLESILKDSRISVIDGGARNGTFELPLLAPYIHAYGFEPNEAEYQKLLSGKTDAYEASGVKPLSYGELTLSPTALAHKNGKQPLYITKGAGACSLMMPDFEITDGYEKTWADNFPVVSEEQVECSTLKTLMEQFKIDYMDYIKLDTQGNEFEILFSEPEVLQSVSVIKTEVEFVPIYKDQKLFCDMDAAMRKAGFHFLDLLVSDDHRIGRGNAPEEQGRKELIWGDAFYVRSLTADEIAQKPLVAFKQALVVLELGYLDYGLHLLNQIKETSLPIETVRQAYAFPAKTWKDRVPVPVKTFARKVLHKVFG